MHSLQEFLDYCAERFGSLEAYVWPEGDAVVSRSFSAWRDDALRMASYIRRAFGTQKKIALIGETSYAWVCAWYGIMLSGNVSVPLDAKLSPPELAERMDFADVSVVLLSRRLAALRDVLRGLCQTAEAVCFLEDEAAQAARERAEALPPADPDALSSLMFTSGTTGDGLKAAMITQRMILADVTGPVPLCVPGDRLLSVLPIHHCFEIFVGQMKYLYLGGTICINDSMAKLLPNLTRFGISIVVAVPALANMLAGMIAQALQSRSVEEVRQMLGGRLRRITIGGASVSKEVLDTLAKAGITIFVGYGLTETTGGCLANCDASIRPREAGAPYVEGMEMKLVEGELCLKGPMIMQGYYKAPALTARVIEDGWLHTGDLAEITDEGYVIILGRKDNMIKTSNGEKVYPEAWENRLTNIPGVAAAMVANVNNHLTALVFLKEDTPEAREAVARAVDAANAKLPNYEKIPDLRFRDRPFPMTTSLKIRRGEVMKELAAQTRRSAAPPQTPAQRQIWEAVSRVLPGAREIGIDDNLFDLGLDSLGALHLALLLDCDAADIYAAKTVRRLAERDDGTAPDSGKTPGVNRFFSEQPEGQAPLGDSVLLTGASGYLGAHLLHELLKSGREVVCLVRDAAGFARSCAYYGFAGDGQRTRLAVGSITEPLLGLSEAEYRALCGEVSSVVHAAALVSHVGSREASARVNVAGTEELIRFCKQSGAALFHISSYAVSGFGTERPLTEAVLDIGQAITQNPYVQSKYQAEERVLCARGEGVASTIFRVGNLTARSTDGVFQRNGDTSGRSAQLIAFRKLGVCPESMAQVPFDATAVDEAARAIVLLADACGTGHVWHIMNPHVRSIAELTGARAVPDRSFVEQMAAQSDDRDIAILSVYYRMKQAGFNTHFDFTATLRELERLGFCWTA